MIDHHRRAIALDPEFTEPYAMLAITYAIRGQGTISAAEALPKAHELVEQIRRLKPTPAGSLALAWVSLALDLDYSQAEANIARAQPFFPPNFLESVRCLIAFTQGHLNEAISHCTRAADTGGSLEIRNLGLVLYFAGRYDDAVDAFRRSLQRSDSSQPDAAELLGYLSSSQFQAGDAVAANATLDDALGRHGDRFPEKYAHSLALLGRTDEARRAVDEMVDRDRRGTRATVDALPGFWTYFYLGDLDEAFVWMQRGIENREYFLIGTLRASPLLDGLREDPRFVAAMARVKEIEEEGSPYQSAAGVDDVN